MPIRGHSNVQGMGSVGVTPTLKKAMLERFEQTTGDRRSDVARPRHDGLHGGRRPRRDGYRRLPGGKSLWQQPRCDVSPSRRLSRIGCIAYLTTTLNTGHAWGRGRETLVLPVLPRDEEPQPTTQESMFSFVRLSDGGPPRYAGPRSEVSLLTALGRALLGESGAGRLDSRWRATMPCDDSMAELIPGYRTDRRYRQDRKGVSYRRHAIWTSGRFPRHRARHVSRGHSSRHKRIGRKSIPDDDGPFRGAVQYGRIRRRGHLSRAGPPRRDTDARRTIFGDWDCKPISRCESATPPARCVISASGPSTCAPETP